MDEKAMVRQLRSLVDDGAPPVALDEVVTGDGSADAGSVTRDRRAWYLGAAATVVAIALIAAVLVARDAGDESVTTDERPPPAETAAEPVLVLTGDERVAAVAADDSAIYVAVNHRRGGGGATLLQLPRATLEAEARYEIPETDLYELPPGRGSAILNLAVTGNRVWLAASDGLNARLLKLEEGRIEEVDLLEGEGTLVVWNGDLYAAGEPGVQRRDAVTGELLATITSGSIGFEWGLLAPGDEALYKTSRYAEVVQAIRDDTISTFWEWDDGAGPLGPIAFADGRLIVSAGGDLVSLDSATGDVLASQSSSGAEALVTDGSTVWAMYADLVRRHEVADLAQVAAQRIAGARSLRAGAVLEPGVLLACGDGGCFRVTSG
jgi:hypothetical protein